MMAIPASASAAISGSTKAGSGTPRQKAWLITTRPCIPSARVRSMMSSIEKHAHLTRLVQMDIDAAPDFFGQPEHRIEMPFGIAIDRTRIEAADRLRAETQRLLQQFERPRPDEQPALRERDDIDVALSLIASRVASTPSMPETPHSVSTSTWLRMNVLPCETASAACRAD